MHGIGLFPEFYRPWLGELLSQTAREKDVNCASCTMASRDCKSLKLVTRDPAPFALDLKCCTHFPFIPNFTLGALLTDPQLASQGELLLESSSLSLLGAFPSAAYLERQRTIGDRGFGRSHELLCPVFDKKSAQCSIWPYRPGVCSSYHCVSEPKGSNGLTDGFRFWSDVESYLNLFEWTLAHEVLWQLGLTQDELAQMQPGSNFEPEWYEYRDRKKELYALTFEKALKVSSLQLVDLMGVEGDLLLGKIKAALR